MTAKDKEKVAKIKTLLNKEVKESENLIKLSKPFSDIDSMILQKRLEAKIDAYNSCLDLIELL